MRIHEINGGFGFENLKAAMRPDPVPGPGEVLMRIRAASLNFRDVLLVRGVYNPKQPLPVIPLSDAAGEVAAVGPGVRRFRPGDRVVNSFSPNWVAGPISAEKLAGGLGSPTDGVLAEYRVFPESALVPTPPELSDIEAATLPCAGVTAWSAIVTLGQVKPGDLVVTQGTGGVSLFALQLAKLAGAQVIATSSSDEKLERARALGADHVINYRREPEWGRAVLKLTDGRGADHIIEVGGATTLMQSVRAVRIGGTISAIGVLSGPLPELNLPLIVMRQVRLQGVTVGPREGLEDLLRAMAQAGLKPAIDSEFDFDEAPAAFRRMDSGGHFGKIVIRV